MTPLPEEGSLGFETARLAAGDRHDCPGLDVLARRRLAAAVRRAGDLPVRHAVPGGGAAPARRWTPGTTARTQYRHPGAWPAVRHGRDGDAAVEHAGLAADHCLHQLRPGRAGG